MLKIQLVGKSPALPEGTPAKQVDIAPPQLIQTPSDGTTPIFHITIFDSIFRIENATHVELFPNIEKVNGRLQQRVLLVTDSILYIVTFQSYCNSNNVLSSRPVSWRIRQHIEAKDISTTASLDFHTLFFKIFSVADKFILFVSKEAVNFDTLRNRKSVLSSETTYAEGFLYDLSSHKQVINNASEGIWSQFFLYDDGIPHIIKKTTPEGVVTFEIIRYCEDSHSFDTVASAEKPLVVSYTDNRVATDGEKNVTRFVFFTAPEKHFFQGNPQMPSEDCYLMMALDENLNKVCCEACVRLHAVNICSRNSTEEISSATTFCHLAANDSLILESCNGKTGNFVLMFLKERPFQVDYTYSFSNFRRLNDKNKIFLCVCATATDYDSNFLVYDLQRHKRYTMTEFARLQAD